MSSRLYFELSRLCVALQWSNEILKPSNVSSSMLFINSLYSFCIVWFARPVQGSQRTLPLLKELCMRYITECFVLSFKDLRLQLFLNSCSRNIWKTPWKTPLLEPCCRLQLFFYKELSIEIFLTAKTNYFGIYEQFSEILKNLW